VSNKHIATRPIAAEFSQAEKGSLFKTKQTAVIEDCAHREKENANKRAALDCLLRLFDSRYVAPQRLTSPDYTPPSQHLIDDMNDTDWTAHIAQS